MGAKFKIAAMEPGFVAHKTQIAAKDIGEVSKETIERAKAKYSPPPQKATTIAVYSQTCSNCGTQHMEESPRKRCSKCGTFLPKGTVIS